MDRIVPIAVVGAPTAGKSTLIARLVNGNFKKISPTVEMDVKHYMHKGISFLLFDLGGEATYNENLWEDYVRSASATIFLVDASAESPIDFSRKLFSKVVAWTERKPIAFLASKCDLPGAMSHREMAEKFDFLGLIFPDRPFRSFRVSAQTGDGINEVMDWLMQEVEKRSQIAGVTLHVAYIFRSDGIPLAELGFGSSLQIDSALVSGFFSAMNEFWKAVAGEEKSLMVQSDQCLLVSIKRGTLLCSVIVNRDDPPTKAHLISEFLISQATNMINQEGSIHSGRLIDSLLNNFGGEVFVPGEKAILESSWKEFIEGTKKMNLRDIVPIILSKDFISQIDKQYKASGVVDLVRDLNELATIIAEKSTGMRSFGTTEELIEAIISGRTPLATFDQVILRIEESLYALRICPFSAGIQAYVHQNGSLPESFKKIVSFHNSIMGESCVHPLCILHQSFREKVALSLMIDGEAVFYHQLACRSSIDDSQVFAMENIEDLSIDREKVSEITKKFYCCFMLRPHKEVLKRERVYQASSSS